ncbi:hypothetical protein FNH05_27750 [Amycolatopsis rhizosphaerae]|uniref:Uncharacterized protein n=1 Tax=Amycolatopsis rhizosphaerae TaxID=2053003 RepID=A0A558B797_9PSEU|nr:hypothetical protein [Amycolatopsis rhizosphaerae]TVT32362.1 hypothetical protein FNH05_27750 [Amycolatopsis rhizosphaerae]
MQDHEAERSDTGFAALEELLRDDLETTIARTLTERSPEPARTFATRLATTDHAAAAHHQEAAGLGRSIAFYLLARSIMSTRGPGDGNVDPAVEWVGRTLGPHCATAAATAARLVRMSKRVDARDSEQLGEDLLPALVWLASSLAATRGHGAPVW